MTTNENIKSDIVEDNNCSEICREEIRIKRRERRHEKKLEKQSQKAKQKSLDADNVKLRHSDKIKIICKNDFELYQANNSNTETKNSNVKHGKYFNIKSSKQFNLFDFANKVEHRRIRDSYKVGKRILPNHYSGRFQNNLKSGKRREGAIRKSKSKLKKLIIRNREVKKTNTLNNNFEDENLSFKDAKDSQTDSVKHREARNETVDNSNLQLDSPEIESLDLSVQKLAINEQNDTNDQIHDIPKNNSVETEWSSEIDDPKQENKTIHSRRFREYCDNITSPNLCKLTEDFIRELFRFQKRAYEKNQIKARAHKRYVFGFRETRNNLLANKLKLVIIAPDIEPCNIRGGLDDTINEIKLKCSEYDIPYLFSLKKRKLAYCCFKKAPISCMGILFYDGAQDIYSKLIECLNMEKEAYLKLISS